MNDLDLCLEVVSRSCQPLRYIRRWISRKPLEIEAWFQRTTNRQKAHVLSNGHVTDDVTWPQRCCEAVRSAILVTAWHLVMIQHDNNTQNALRTLKKSVYVFWVKQKLLKSEPNWQRKTSEWVLDCSKYSAEVCLLDTADDCDNFEHI